jgi:hypothetical protein
MEGNCTHKYVLFLLVVAATANRNANGGRGEKMFDF